MIRLLLPRATIHPLGVGWPCPSWGSATTKNPIRPAHRRAAAPQVREAMRSWSHRTRRARVKMSSVTRIGCTVASSPK